MTAWDAVIFLPFTLAIGIWVAWSDMKTMKIPNQAVVALFGVWVVLGLVLVPWQLWGWGMAFGAVALVIGFVATILKLFGAGDAKFIAAMAPFFVQGDVGHIMLLSATVMVGALAAHRGARAIPALQSQFGEWASWHNKDFPMGLALAGILNIYLVLKAQALVLA
jgi:prepilin peptidase CpaA